MSGSKSNRGPKNRNVPTSSSNSDANTDEGNLIPGYSLTGINNVCSCALLREPDGISSEGPEGSLRCCR
uniref:Uncharacterized protein n=1 Tax=Monodelphis domestica TaxID=13616 RepID=A0A5F8GJE9_MONDO